MLVISFIFITACGTDKNYRDNSDTRDTYVQTSTDQGESPYQCDGRQYCSEMDSYEEAKFFLEHCPNVKMDGDHDGIPCEKQFNH